jgi:hypothetical protein
MYAAEQQAIIDSFARSVQAGLESPTSIAIIMGGGTRGDQWAHAVKDRLATWGVAASPAAEIRRIIMSSQRAQREASTALMQELIAAGYTPYNPKQGDYTAVVRVHLDGCESGEYPTATKTAQAVVGDMATRLLAKTNKKRLRRAFQENKEHPGMRRISAIADNSAVVAAASASVSTCLGTLANTHKIARMMDEQLRRTKALEAELAAVRAEATRANARLDLQDQGKDWKEAARAVLASEPAISNRELARRVGRDEKSIRKYLKDIKGGVAD